MKRFRAGWAQVTIPALKQAENITGE